MKKIKISTAETAGLAAEDVEVYCFYPNVSIPNLIRLYRKNPQQIDSDPKTKKLFNQIVKEIQDDDVDSILVYGFSFGGAVVNRISDLLDDVRRGMDYPDELTFSKLHMATFGSAYLSENKNESDRHVLINYLAKHDIVSKVNYDTEDNTQNEPLELGKEVTYRLKQPPIELPERIRRICLQDCGSTVGFNAKVRIHFGYDKLFKTLVSHKTENFDALQLVKTPGSDPTSAPVPSKREREGWFTTMRNLFKREPRPNTSRRWKWPWRGGNHIRRKSRKRTRKN